MDTVSDVTDRHLGWLKSRIQFSEHFARNHPVQSRNTIGASCYPQTHVGHIEHAVVAFYTKRKCIVYGHAREQLRHTVVVCIQVASHHHCIEAVDSGWHRGVSGEDIGRPDFGQCLRVAHAAVSDPLGDAFESEESGVTFVEMRHRRSLCSCRIAIGIDRPHTPNTENELLTNPVFLIAAVETISELANLGVVFVDIGVEKEQWDASNTGHPHGDLDARMLRERDGDAHLLPVSIQQRLNGKLTGTVHRIGFFLTPITREGLGKVAIGVQQSNSDQRHTQV